MDAQKRISKLTLYDDAVLDRRELFSGRFLDSNEGFFAEQRKTFMEWSAF